MWSYNFLSDITSQTKRNLILETRNLIDQAAINISSNFKFPVSSIDRRLNLDNLVKSKKACHCERSEAISYTISYCIY